MVDIFCFKYFDILLLDLSDCITNANIYFPIAIYILDFIVAFLTFNNQWFRLENLSQDLVFEIKRFCR